MANLLVEIFHKITFRLFRHTRIYNLCLKTNKKILWGLYTGYSELSVGVLVSIKGKCSVLNNFYAESADNRKSFGFFYAENLNLFALNFIRMFGYYFSWLEN